MSRADAWGRALRVEDLGEPSEGLVYEGGQGELESGTGGRGCRESHSWLRACVDRGWERRGEKGCLLDAAQTQNQ